MAQDDTPPAEDGGEDALEKLVSKVNEGTRNIVNEILDERLRVNEPPAEKDGEEENGDGEGEGKPPEDEPPAPKTLAEKLGF